MIDFLYCLCLYNNNLHTYFTIIMIITLLYDLLYIFNESLAKIYCIFAFFNLLFKVILTFHGLITYFSKHLTFFESQLLF
jgi:hypothetical protein